MPSTRARTGRASYGEHYDRLAAIKGKYDPNNLFRVSQNIEPA
jgi:FAD/FMN-containing dehydrogenase